jgi:antitoxin component HigA of HigAB toxin-antitoxin module
MNTETSDNQMFRMSEMTIDNESDYEQALLVLESLWDAEPGSKDEEQLVLVAAAVETYEKENFPIDPPKEENNAS